MGKDLNKAREVYFDLLKPQKMAHTKHFTKKRVVREGRRPPEAGKEPWVAVKCSGEEAKRKSRRYQPRMKVLWEIWKFQETTELLIPKIAMFCLVREIVQKEHSWLVYTSQCCVGHP